MYNIENYEYLHWSTQIKPERRKYIRRLILEEDYEGLEEEFNFSINEYIDYAYMRDDIIYIDYFEYY